MPINSWTQELQAVISPSVWYDTQCPTCKAGSISIGYHTPFMYLSTLWYTSLIGLALKRAVTNTVTLTLMNWHHQQMSWNESVWLSEGNAFIKLLITAKANKAILVLCNRGISWVGYLSCRLAVFFVPAIHS